MRSTQISESKAKEYIQNYRKDLPPGSLRSAWLNRDFIDAVLELSATHQLDGVRVYLAKYTESDPESGIVKDDVTVIIVPTESGITGTKIDVKTAYYDYSSICPPHCDGDNGD